MSLENRLLIGSFVPDGVVGSYEETRGLVIDTHGQPVKADDMNRILDSRGYTLRAWGKEGTPEKTIRSDEKIYSDEQPKKKPGFLQKAGLTLGSLLIAASAIVSTDCTKGGGGPTTPPAPTPVSLELKVYNHRLGERGGYNINKKADGTSLLSGDQVIITTNDLITRFGINDVDPQRIAIRENNFGKLITFSNNGTASFTAPAPIQNSNIIYYDIFLFNSTNSAPYHFMDHQNSQLYLKKRNFILYRQDSDGQNGPEEVWANAIDPADTYLKPENIPFRYGSAKRLPTGTSGDFSYGFANCGGADGYHAGSWIAVNWNKYPDTYAYKSIWATNIAISEFFENITGVDDIGTPFGVNYYPAINGRWRESTIDLFLYVFAKDSADK
jgi:hypothetical protein